MIRSCFLLFFVVALSACTVSVPPRKAVSVRPGELFAGSYINVKAPASDGWQLAQASDFGMAFAKGGQVANESFVAQVLMFNLPPSKTPEEFEAFIKAAVMKDTDPNRFNVQKMSTTYTSERSYPCVRVQSVMEDNAPQGIAGPLVLEAEGLYCRHPVRQETGFAIIYSHRGKSLYANLRSESESFIQDVQVPEGSDGVVASLVPSQESHSRIHLYRPDSSSIVGVAEVPFVYLDGQRMGRLGKGCVLVLPITPGTHTVQMKASFLTFIPSYSLGMIELQTNDPEEIYLRFIANVDQVFGPNPVLTTFLRVPENTGREETRELRNCLKPDQK